MPNCRVPPSFTSALGVAALGAEQTGIEVELIDLIDPAHGQQSTSLLWHLPQAAIKPLAAEEEAAVEYGAVAQCRA